MRALARGLAFVLALHVGAAPCFGFSVLAHQAIVDRSWNSTIAPALQRRFPGSATDLTPARSFAYGGSHIADLGYYPFGDRLFTELLHYVRTGDFITTLIASAETVDEYAFALGALAHYVGDTTGHAEATNRVVPELYPELREKFGDRVTYADDHAAHLQTEFRFDVLQMVEVKGGHDVLHHSLQFEVATRVLDDAFSKTYGLRLDDLFESPDAAILTYRYVFRGLVHEATGIAWELYRGDIEKRDPGMTADEFVYDLSREDFEKEFGTDYSRPNYLVRFFGFVGGLVPNVGPLKRTIFEPLPSEVQQRFHTTLDRAVERFQTKVAAVSRKGLTLAPHNLDTGTVTAFGEYPPADDAYAALVKKLADGSARAPVALRSDLRRFYGTRPVDAAAKRSDRELNEALARVLD